MKHGIKIKIAEKSGYTKGFISRVLSESDPCTPSWAASKIFGFVTSTNPVLWADKNIPALEIALENLNEEDLRQYIEDGEQSAIVKS